MYIERQDHSVSFFVAVWEKEKKEVAVLVDVGET